MLYSSVHLPIPDEPRYEITKIRKNDAYLYYRVRSYHNEAGQKKHERIMIGKVFTDAQTGLKYFSPNDRYYTDIAQTAPPAGAAGKGRGRPRRSKPVLTYSTADAPLGFGCMLACMAVIKELQLDVLLDDAFGSLSSSIIAVSAFLAAGAPGGMSSIDHFTQKNMCFTPSIIDSSALSALYSSLRHEMMQDFFRQWVRRCCSDDYVCYDVTSISSCSADLPFIAWGCNRDKEKLPQFNLGMFCTLHSKLPVYFAPYNGSINDYSNLPCVMQQAKLAGLDPASGEALTLVMDGGFAVPEVIERAARAGYQLIIGAPKDFGVKVRSNLLDWRRSGCESRLIRRGDEAIRCHEAELCIGRLRTRLLMYKSPKSALDQESSLNSIINQLEGELKDKKRFLKHAVTERYEPFFKVSLSAQGGSFTYSLDESAYREALELCGCFALFCTNDRLDCETALELYRAKDCVEKAFAIYKNDILDERIRTKSLESTNGKLFLAFIALIIRRTLDGRLRPYLNKSRISLDSAIFRLADIVCHKQGDDWALSSALTKTQKELIEILQLPISRLDPVSNDPARRA